MKMIRDFLNSVNFVDKSAHGDLGIFFWASWENQLAFASRKINDFSRTLP